MTDWTQAIALGSSLVLLLVVLELVRRRTLLEEYAFVWIALAVLLLGLAARPSLFARAAGWLRVGPSITVGLLSTLVLVLSGALALTVIVSRQRRQIERLIEDTAVLAAEVRQLREDRRTGVDRPEASVALGSPNRPRR